MSKEDPAHSSITLPHPPPPRPLLLPVPTNFLLWLECGGRARQGGPLFEQNPANVDFSTGQHGWLVVWSFLWFVWMQGWIFSVFHLKIVQRERAGKGAKVPTHSMCPLEQETLTVTNEKNSCAVFTSIDDNLIQEGTDEGKKIEHCSIGESVEVNTAKHSDGVS